MSLTETPPLRVSGKTDPAKLAKTIALTLRDTCPRLKVRAMGPHAVNQTVKGLILARQFLAATNHDFDIVPAFDTQKEGDDEVTVIVFSLALIDD